MKTQPPKTLESPENRGFALVVTLSLMILLTVIAVGLLTLSSVSLRSSSSSMAMAEARQNARLSIQMALAQLQSLTGQDTRVTASSNVLNPSLPSVTGAWRSWEGANHDVSGKPTVPDYNSKKIPGDPATSPGSAVNGRFLGWLTSTAAYDTPNANDVPNVSKTLDSGMVPMVASGSVIDSSRQVHMRPTLVNNSKGAIAWWTSGDNAKAMVNTDRALDPSTIVGWQTRVRSNGRADAKTFGLEKVNDYAPGTVVPTTGNLKLAGPSADLRKIHDLTAFSRGLLTNTATGGWRKDMSLMTENFNSLPTSQLPSFTLTPGKDLTFSKAQMNSTAGNPILYPWARYQNNGTGWAGGQAPPVCSWSALVDYTQQYTKLDSNSALRTTMAPTWKAARYWDAVDRLEFLDRVRRAPQIARVQWIYSIGSRLRVGSNPPTYNPGILVTPILTIWNPYNVEITVPNFAVSFQETAPIRFKLKVGNTSLPEVSVGDLSRAIISNTNAFRFYIEIDDPITLAPGATKIFSTTDSQPSINTSAVDVKLKPGYSPGGGVLFTFINKSTSSIQEFVANATDIFKVEKITYDAPTPGDGKIDRGKNSFGIWYDMIIAGRRVAASRMQYNTDDLGGAAIVDQLYPPLVKTIQAPVSSINVINAAAGSIPSQPFGSALFGYRMVSPLSRDPKLKHLLSKGMLQANPLTCFSALGLRFDWGADVRGTGNHHPINAPYDFAFQEMTGWNDTMAGPQWESSTGSSYIVSGLGPSDGLTRCVMAELPTRPLQSLAELQHFDARNNNPTTPFQFNLIGNGSAHPIFAPDQPSVQVANHQNGWCNDDTYMLNHLLFDDWFFSSIAKELNDFGSGTKRTVNSVYQDHLNLTKELPNRFYLPAPGAASPTASAAVTAAMSNDKDTKTGKYQYETIASKLEVDGMFNINSVSLEAWKAILRQSRDIQVPYLAPDGSTKLGAASAVSYAYPRSSIAGDQVSDSGSKASGSLFPAAAEFAGSRVLTDVQIDALAEEIVMEIQKRGPFLSLGEFVNRQLTTNKDLAIASTIQKALDNLSKLGSSMKNPFAAIQSVAPNITTTPPGTTDYKFPEAALGSSAFGVPGWIRQADILKPLAPILSARDDTFTIRAYGDSREKGNPTKIVAMAWCEVVVQRKADYVDPSEPPAIAPFSDLMVSAPNKRFGRRYEIVSFRWLSKQEI